MTHRKLLSRKSYVLRALFILLAMSISVTSLFWFVHHDGSPWWLIAADILLLVSCRQAFAAFLETCAPIIAATDIFGIVLLAILILAAPLLAPIALVWTIRQVLAAR